MKKKKPSRPMQVVGFEAELSLRDKLDKLAEEKDRSRSWVIRQLLSQALETPERKAS